MKATVNLLMIFIASLASAAGGISSGGDEAIPNRQKPVFKSGMTCFGGEKKSFNKQAPGYWIMTDSQSFTQGTQLRLADFTVTKMVVRPDIQVVSDLVFSNISNSFELHYGGEQVKMVVNLKPETDELGDFYFATMSTFNNYPVILTNEKFRCRP